MASDTDGDTQETPSDTQGDAVEISGSAPVLSLRDAVEACGVSRATLQRRLKAGAVAGAERSERGGWRIPVSGLIAAGLAPRRTPAEHPEPVVADVGELEQLRSALAVALSERDHARELAAVHEAQAQALQQTMLQLARALPAGPGRVSAVEPERPSRRRWRRRQ